MTETLPGGAAPHGHNFDAPNPLGERRTRHVVILTALTMVVEIIGGWWYGSMAVLADGWHMSSHVIALGLSVAAYVLARRLRQDDRFAFGTWKIEVLGGYTSALLLTGVVLYMVIECLGRLWHPTTIAYNQALGVAVLGLAVNLASAWLLAGAAQGGGHDHGHDPHDPHDPHDDHKHGHVDLNLRSAYVHVAADAGTSILAIAALSGGKYFHLAWLDAAVGLFGSVVVAAWAWTLLRSTGRILLDAEMDAPVVARIRAALSAAPIPVVVHDLHVWRVGKGNYACILGVTTDAGVTPEYFRSLLRPHGELVHVTVEVNPGAVTGP